MKELYKVFFYGNKNTPTSPNGESHYMESFENAEIFKNNLLRSCDAVDIATYIEDEDGFLTYDDGVSE